MPELPDPKRPDNWKEEVAEVHHRLAVGLNPYLRYIWEYATPENVALFAVEIQMTPKSTPVKTEFTATPLQAYDLLLQQLSGPATSVKPTTSAAAAVPPA